jgi:hypothetical protein
MRKCAITNPAHCALRKRSKQVKIKTLTEFHEEAPVNATHVLLVGNAPHKQGNSLMITTPKPTRIGMFTGDYGVVLKNPVGIVGLGVV